MMWRNMKIFNSLGKQHLFDRRWETEIEIANKISLFWFFFIQVISRQQYYYFLKKQQTVAATKNYGFRILGVDSFPFAIAKTKFICNSKLLYLRPLFFFWIKLYTFEYFIDKTQVFIHFNWQFFVVNGWKYQSNSLAINKHRNVCWTGSTIKISWLKAHLRCIHVYFIPLPLWNLKLSHIVCMTWHSHYIDI